MAGPMASWNPSELDALLSGRRRDVAARLLRAALSAGEPLYFMAGLLRNLAYDLGAAPVYDLGRPTVSVGNVTTGGVGKTPMVAWLARALAVRGHRPAVLMRGYRVGGMAFSDEQHMLREMLPGVAVVADGDRRTAARQALAECPQTTVFLLDDGFQHRRAQRCFDLVLLHAGEAFGHGHLLPRGLLREPVSSLRRADAVVLTHADEVSAEALASMRRRCARLMGGGAVFTAAHRLTGIELEGARHPLSELAGRAFVAFAGLASPASFERGVRELGDCRAVRSFADHHAYCAADLAEVCAAAKARGAGLLLTTAKDWVKVRRLPCELPVASLCMELAVDDVAGLVDAVARAVGEPAT